MQKLTVPSSPSTFGNGLFKPAANVADVGVTGEAEGGSEAGERGPAKSLGRGVAVEIR